MKFLTPTCRILVPLGPQETFHAFPLEPALADARVLQAVEAQGLLPFFELADHPVLFRKRYVPGILEGVAHPRLLVIRFGGIGDVLWTLPALRALKVQYPTLHLAYMVAAKDREALLGVPFIDEILVTDRPTVAQAMTFDAILDFYECVENNRDQKIYDPIDICCDWVGVAPQNRLPLWTVFPHEAEWAETWLNTQGVTATDELVGIPMTASSPHRTWVYWAELVAQVLAQYPKAKIVLSGAMQHGVPLVEEILQKFPQHPRIVNAFGRTTLRQAVAVLARCRVVVSPDTGLVHVMGALSRPTVVIYSTVPAETRCTHYPTVQAVVVGVPCAPCYKLNESCEWGDRCMTTLAPLQVMRAIQEVPHGLTKN